MQERERRAPANPNASTATTLNKHSKCTSTSLLTDGLTTPTLQSKAWGLCRGKQTNKTNKMILTKTEEILLEALVKAKPEGYETRDWLLSCLEVVLDKDWNSGYRVMEES